ncbi:LytR C-terminal domain-containing protein [Plantactinospora sp. CA-294935]|uniref:LytR C-terminal domain-containing protein n=1 Tax=Plantactinospora sp. CA-294935 TaxID=3240012 RepID=UPI003D9275C9
MTFARVRALLVVGVLAVIAIVFVAVTLVRDTQAGKEVASDCQEGDKLADTRLRHAKDIKINVYNATETAGLANTVKTDFQNRQFKVLKAGNEPAKKGIDDEVAVLRFGPKGVGSYQVLRAYFLNKAEPEFQLDRKDDVVDVVIGGEFKQLATITEVNQALTQRDSDSTQLPPRTCADPNLN